MLMNEPVQPDPAIACEFCGRFGAFVIGDRRLCEDCYEAQGSCCPEFGGSDLWKEREEEKADRP